MPGSAVPLRAVTALFLERQHLARPRARTVTARRLGRFVEDVGGVQMDSINVLDRAHYLTVWSRFGPYDRAWLDRLVYRRRLLFEYWAHAACLVPTTMLPWWRRAMLDYRVRHTGWSDWLRRNSKVLDRVKAAILANGPMANGDFDGRRRSGAGGWWNWRPVQHALHYLWMTGALTIHSRQHFQKRFDLLERAIPSALGCEPVSPEDFQRWHVERSLHAMGAATEQDLTGYLTFPRFGPGVRRAALRAMIERGEVAELEVEGQPSRWLVLTRDLPALARARRAPAASRGTTLLSPFDSLLWYRDRVARLFGFDYRIEVYTPGPKRVHGYYTLPILHDGHLIGRVDAKSHRAERRLEIRHVHFERWFADGKMPPTGGTRLDRDEALGGLGNALAALGTFVGAGEVEVGRVTPPRLRVTPADGGSRLPRDDKERTVRKRSPSTPTASPWRG
ncbi:MAG TPA: crosslink repair DNA glycosylase YcaQ family protein [Methylomirabilota bacterium]|nr:crosslink repair DNA glycosylase YcaQ family protein [Methylomirabilota bacterium]